MQLSQVTSVHASYTEVRAFIPSWVSPCNETNGRGVTKWLACLPDITIKQSLSGGVDPDEMDNDIRGLLEMKKIKGAIQFKKELSNWCSIVSLCQPYSLSPH
jgi:hypothetical protein